MLKCIERVSCCRFPCFSESRDEAGKSRISTLAMPVIAAVGAVIALAAFFSHMPLLAFGSAIISGAAFTCHLVSGSVRKKEASVETNSEIEKSPKASEKDLGSASVLKQSESQLASDLASEKLEASGDLGESSSPPQKALHPVQPFLAPDVPLEELQEYIKQNCQVVKTTGASMEELRELHEAAKAEFQSIFEGDETFGTTVRYISPNDLKLEAVHVEQAPHAALKSNEAIHIYSIATQSNGCEKKFQKQPSLGKAALQNDENSLAAINPKLLELVSAYLSNGGFNMFAPVLTEETKRCLLKGYLRLKCDKDARELLELDWNLLELPCITSRLGLEEVPVHLILGASPPWGLYFKRLPSSIDQTTEVFDQLCHRMAVANYTAQFSYALLVAKNNPEKTVTLHISIPKLQTFHNDPKVVMDALSFAAANLRKKMQEEKIENIIVKTSNA